MDYFKEILQKLEGFIKRYYWNELIKGTILFFSIGLLYFILTLLIEHFLWLNTGLRAILFWLFVLVEMILFSVLIVIPLSKLFKLKKGISYEEASKLIGSHFTEVNDKLLNVLQLSKDGSKSELLLASINQKSESLRLVPFKLAINFKKNLKYLQYAAIPVFIFLSFIIIGKASWFTDSYKRMVDYKTAYEPPAPFQFYVINEHLQTIENKDFKLLVKAVGAVIPEQVEISFNNEIYVLKPNAPGSFEYIFQNPKHNILFQIQANSIRSKTYELAVVEVPSLLGFDMILNYPAYTQKQAEVLKGSGNAIVPEGTKVVWKLKTKSTDKVALFANDTLWFKRSKSDFEAEKLLFSNFNYSLSTSNAKLENYENLSFAIEVIKDQYPEISVEMVKDSIHNEAMYFKGNVSDDYGLLGLNLVYFEHGDDVHKMKVQMDISRSNVDQFITSFPNQLQLKEGVSYSVYFEVFDNDANHHYKRTVSETFSYRSLTDADRDILQLLQQQKSINDLNNSLDRFDKNEKILEDLSKAQKSKSTLNFNDKKKLDEILKQQELQQNLMKNFNKSFQENLKDFKEEPKTKGDFKEQLEKRLEENEKKLQEDDKLMEELRALQDKINSEEFSKKLDNLAKQNKSQKRSLEQLLELTKRYYVSQKAEKLQQDLDKLSNKQLEESNQNVNENSYKNQNSINDEFKDFQKELDALNKDNNALKRPLDLQRDINEENQINQLQQEASEKLKDNSSENNKGNDANNSKAKQNQKRAGQKMKELSNSMKNAMQSGGGEQMQEDAELLRQILDNLLLFSFNEESLMNRFKTIDVNHNIYAASIKRQYDLKSYFEHVDDSLFALSLRQPLLSEQVNTELSNVYFNLDKALDHLSENNLSQGIASQQYVFTAANTLADLLSTILDNMEDQLNNASSSGQGSDSKNGGKGEQQLQDIIMSQQQLNDMMKETMSDHPEGNQNGEKGKSNSDGQSGDGNKSQGDKPGDIISQQSTSGGSEAMNQNLFEIYKRQQELRNQLEDLLQQQGLSTEAKSLLNSMEEVEMELLNDGLTKQTLEKMKNFQHQLLKLQDATFQQEQDTKRVSNTNSKSFNSTVPDMNSIIKQYFNTTEILNRQTLPLQPSFKRKVQQYFKQDL